MHRLFARLRAAMATLQHLYVRYGPPGQAQSLEAELREEAARALSEWQAAQAYFQSVSDHQLVDHAIYQMEAASHRYIYLWSQLRVRQGTAPVVADATGGYALVDSIQ